jgi:hypothetical protein
MSATGAKQNGSVATVNIPDFVISAGETLSVKTAARSDTAGASPESLKEFIWVISGPSGRLSFPKLAGRMYFCGLAGL